jgi:hypothetical protein
MKALARGEPRPKRSFPAAARRQRQIVGGNCRAAQSWHGYCVQDRDGFATVIADDLRQPMPAEITALRVYGVGAPSLRLPAHRPGVRPRASSYFIMNDAERAAAGVEPPTQLPAQK